MGNMKRRETTGGKRWGAWCAQAEQDDELIQTPTATIPKIIHQTWKSHSLPSWSKASSWKERNPKWQYQLWDDDEAAELVRSHFPRVWGIWNRLRPVERADVFRYAMVFVHGGVYADLDVECVRPIDTWPGISNGGIVGIEGVMRDEAEMRSVKFVAMTQYCQWTFAFAPKHQILRRALDIVVQRVNAGVQDTLTKTGPGVFTAALASIEPDVRVLPGNAFAAGGYSNSPIPTKDTLVKHEFVGSWKGWKTPTTPPSVSTHPPPPTPLAAVAYVPG